MKFHYPMGATPLDLDEMEELIPIHIATQQELNEWEQANIIDAENWLFSIKHSDILTIDFIKMVHKKCLARHGDGQESFVKQIKTSGLIGKSSRNV